MIDINEARRLMNNNYPNIEGNQEVVIDSAIRNAALSRKNSCRVFIGYSSIDLMYYVNKLQGMRYKSWIEEDSILIQW